MAQHSDNMPCHGQSFVTSKADGSNSEYLNDSFMVENIADTATEKGKTMGSGSEEVSVSEDEVWVMKKNLSEMQISVENLEHLIGTMTTKQNELMEEMHELKCENSELREECRLQQCDQTLERTTVLNELYEIKLGLGTRTKFLEDTVKKNTELTDLLKDANNKIYMLAMKFLNLKSKSKAAAKHTSITSATDRSSGSSSNIDDSDVASIYSSGFSE